MKLKRFIDRSVASLQSVGIATARLDVLVLLEDTTDKDRAWLLAHPEFELTSAHTAQLKKLLKKRAQHVPLAYVRGYTEFYGRTFVITPDVLEPRPESETMIDEIKRLVKEGAKLRIGDVGAGSGALGITAKLELPAAQVDLLEIDPEAVKVTKLNVDKFTLNINIIESDLLGTNKKVYDVLLCNLPYVPDDFQINTAASHEPRLAIFGGPDGLDVYRKLFGQIKSSSEKPLYILCESLPPQHGLLDRIALQAGYKLGRENDFISVYKRVK